jgi:hypothetical protein
MFCRIFLHQLVLAPVNVVKTLENILCTFRDGVHLGPEKDTCWQAVYQSLSIDTTLRLPLFSLDSAFNGTVKWGGGCEWYQSIDLYFFYISAIFYFFLKDPGPLKGKKRRLNNFPCNLIESWYHRCK